MEKNEKLQPTLDMSVIKGVKFKTRYLNLGIQVFWYQTVLKLPSVFFLKYVPIFIKGALMCTCMCPCVAVIFFNDL